MAPGLVQPAALPMGLGSLDLLRALPASGVLRHCGAVLRDSAGDAKTYALSRPATRVGTFLSHNWATARPQKFLACSLHFRLRSAVLAWLLASAFAAALAAAGWAPTMEANWHVGPRRQPLAAILVGPAAFCLALLCGPARGTVFLDKVCIHQVNPRLKAEGVAALGAFIQASDKMLVVYSDHYLKRLWTVYEFVSHICLHRESSDLVVVPVWLPSLCLAGMLLMWVSVGVQLVAMLVGGSKAMLHVSGVKHAQMAVASLCFLPFLTALVVVARREGRSLDIVEKQIDQFTLDATECSVPEDREMVYRNIDTLVWAAELAPPDSSAAERRAIVDGIVRERATTALTQAMGRSGIPYRCALIVSLPIFSLCMDSVAQMLAEGCPPRHILVTVPLYFGQGFLTMPLVMAIAMRAGALSVKHHWTAWQEALCLVGGVLATEAILVSVVVLPRHLGFAPVHSDPALCLFGFAYVLVALAVYMAYDPHWRPKRCL